MITPEQITAVILAGGEGRRMGGLDKGLMAFNGKTMIEHVLERISPPLTNVIISANRNLDRYQSYGYPVITDQQTNQGPLAGILQALQHSHTEWLLTVPCDAPFLPDNLVSRLLASSGNTEASILTAHDGKRLQPLCSLIRTDRTQSLKTYLDTDQRSVTRWLEQQGYESIDFSEQREAFVNINTQAALQHCTHRKG